MDVRACVDPWDWCLKNSNVEVSGPAFRVPYKLNSNIDIRPASERSERCRTGPTADDYPAVNYTSNQHNSCIRPMPAFASKPLNRSPLYRRLKRHPALFGVPFLLVMVGASFGLQTFTQTRYDLHSQKVTQVRAARY